MKTLIQIRNLARRILGQTALIHRKKKSLPQQNRGCGSSVYVDRFPPRELKLEPLRIFGRVETTL